MEFLIAQALYFLLPVYAANMAPVIFKKTLQSLAIPIDGGKTLRGKRVFGDHKTLRGYVVGIALATVITFLQFKAQSHTLLLNLSILPYDQWILLGPVLGFTALAGDSVKSFFKRQLDIKPGQKFIPFDQLDFIIGALIGASFFVPLDWLFVFTCLFMSFFLHIFVNHIAFYLHIRQEKW